MDALLVALAMALVSLGPMETARLVVLGFLGLVAMLLLKQNAILFQPQPPGLPRRIKDNPALCRSPEEFDLKFREAWVQAADGVRLHAWLLFCQSPKERPCILYLHGNAGNIGFRLDLFHRMVKRLNVNIFALEYRGFGDSDGSPSEQGLIADAHAALQWLKVCKDIDPEQIFLLGTSLGGAVALPAALANEDVLRGVIIENSFTSTASIACDAFPFLRVLRPLLVRPFLVNEFPSLLLVRKLRRPVLFVCGANDQVIPPAHSAVLYSAATSAGFREHKILCGGHNDLAYVCEPEYFEALQGFMERCKVHHVGGRAQIEKNDS